MLLLAVLAAQAAPASPPPMATLQATATVRIERPMAIGPEEWERVAAASKREMVVSDEQRQPVLLRLVEGQ